ncbi:MAG TPA: glycosyltransferase family 2 protein [Verrucomicrobiae bacterium]
MAESPVISVVIPCYNEQGNIVPLVTSISESLEPLKIAYEIVITDDCSKDGSWNLLQKLAADNPKICVQRLAKNSGQSAALWAGIKAARGRYIATLDADLQNDPRDLPKFLEAIKNADCVCGSRIEKRRQGDNFIRQISSQIANGVRNWITHETVTDSGCCYRVFKRECVANLKFFRGMHRFMPTLFKIDGYAITEIPVNHQHRLTGASNYGVWNRLFASSYDLFAVRWMQKRMFRFSVRERINLPDDAAKNL